MQNKPMMIVMAVAAVAVIAILILMSGSVSLDNDITGQAIGKMKGKIKAPGVDSGSDEVSEALKAEETVATLEDPGDISALNPFATSSEEEQEEVEEETEESQEEQSDEGAWEGNWRTTWDEVFTAYMTLEQDGNAVDGTYGDVADTTYHYGFIQGTVSGDVLSFSWWEIGSDGSTTASGGGEWEISSSGNSFDGSYGTGTNSYDGDWDGTRTS